jgi:acyl-CoA thioesterase
VSAEDHAHRMLANDLATRSLGIEISEVSPGCATATMTVRPEMSNGHGICHGGYVFLLADTAFAFACNTYGTPTVAAGADVEYLAPVAVGDRLVAQAHEVALRGRAGVYDAVVRRGDEVVATFRGRSRALRPA